MPRGHRTTAPPRARHPGAFPIKANDKPGVEDSALQTVAFRGTHSSCREYADTSKVDFHFKQSVVKYHTASINADE
jgi:hypothetical protein